MIGKSSAVNVRYEPSRLVSEAGGATLVRLCTNGERSQPNLSATLLTAGVFRDALSCVGDVLASDLRYKQRDRAEYLEYLRAQGKTATKEIWEAEKAFLEEKYGEQTTREQALDPLVHVGPESISFEVFSADESAYARLELFADKAYRADSYTSGTTNLRFDEQLVPDLSSVRSYRPTRLDVTASSEGECQALVVPHRWLRAFGQMQAAATLPASSFELSPIDVYNLLFELSRKRAKNSPRALRYELVPAQVPRMVLQPWDLAIEATSGPFKGTRPVVARTWGRRRLLVLGRVLPHLTRVTVHVLGAGLPVFYVLELGDSARLTLSLSGWTDSGWAGVATFDLFHGGQPLDELLVRRVLDALNGGAANATDLARQVGQQPGEVQAALVPELLRGTVRFDVATQRYAKRSLLDNPPQLGDLRFRDQREETAHRLLAEDGVRITKIHEKHGEGVQIEGEVHDSRARRTFHTSFLLDSEGRTISASCTSPEFRRSGLREGPSAPMIALRLLYSRQKAELEKARQTAKGRRLIRAETRTLIRRQGDHTDFYRVSLDGCSLALRWGIDLETPRLQSAWYEAEDEARERYFAKLEELGAKGFIDATAAELV